MLIQEEYFKNIFNTVREAILILDENMRVLSANRSFFTIFRVDSANTIGSLLYDLGNGQWDIPYLRVLLEDILPKNDTVDDYEIEHNFESIGQKTMLLNACKIREKKNDQPIILLAIEDITERKEIEAGLENTRKELEETKIDEGEAHEYAESIINTVREPLIALDQNLRVVSASRSFYVVFKVKPEETVGQLIYDLGNGQWNIPKLRELLETILPQKTTFDNYEVEHDFAAIGRRTMLLNARQIKRAFGKERIILLAIEDITERKRLEDLLTESEMQYRRLFETASDGILLLEKSKGDIVHANPAAGKMLGYSEKESIGKKMHDIGISIGTSDFPVMMQALDKRGILNYNDVPVKTKSGQYIDTDIYMVDRAKLAQCNIRDVSERKQAEESLKKEEIKYRELAESISDIFFAMDQDLRYTYWNRSSEKLTGILAKDAVGKRLSDIFPDNEATRELQNLYLDVIRTKEVRHFTSMYPGGRNVIHEVSVYPSKNGVSVFVKDITESKKAEDLLRESEERFRQIAESTEEWIWEVNKDGLYTYASHVVEEILGYKPGEIVGKKYFYDFFPSDKREQMKKEAFDVFASKRAFAKYVNPNSHKNGSIVILETSGAPILNSRGDLLGYRGVDVDITEHRKLEAQLRHSQKMEAVGTLAGGIAHDFNNILNVIIGYGTMVLDKLEAGSPSREQMNEVLTAAERAATLTKRLLVFSRKQVVEVSPVNINELILGLQKMLVRIISESIEFNLDLADRPLTVLADPGLIEQVLINLASNAKDAMQEGGRLTISTGLAVLDDECVAAYGFGKPGRYALIKVADTGHGMDADTQKHIFEPFFTTKGIGEGTGLGLAISYGIIKKNDGYIMVYSEPGKGTEFKIYLPVIEESASPDKNTGAPAAVRGGNETVLVAEDDAPLRKLAKIVLESFGYSVITAVDGDDAITKFMEGRERIDLVMLDMIMPKKNGKEVSEVLRKASPRTKILFASGYTMDTVKTHELTESGFDFIHKPIRPQDLLKKVREILDR